VSSRSWARRCVDAVVLDIAEQLGGLRRLDVGNREGPEGGVIEVGDDLLLQMIRAAWVSADPEHSDRVDRRRDDLARREEAGGDGDRRAVDAFEAS
jgi:hypothetical protein